jgi:hypothetical protein
MNRNRLIIPFVFFIFLICVFAPCVKAIEKSLVLYFPFEEVKANVVSDQSGNGFTGKLIGAVEYTKDGRFGGALSFDGKSGLVRVEDDDKLDLEGSYTVMAWAYPTMVDGGFRWIMDKSTTNADLNYILGISSNNCWRFITRLLTNDLIDGTVVKAQTWYHVAGVQDGSKGQVYLYVNGKAVVNKPLGGDKMVNDSYLSIGCRKDAGNPTQFFAGIIDDLAAFNRALSDADIKSAMNNMANFLAVSPGASLVATWGNLKAQR